MVFEEPPGVTPLAVRHHMLPCRLYRQGFVFVNSIRAAFRDKQKTNVIASEFERLLGRAAFRLRPDLPRDVQERLFETAVPLKFAFETVLQYFFTTIIPRRHILRSRRNWA
jgi:hypothetical protein